MRGGHPVETPESRSLAKRLLHLGDRRQVLRNRIGSAFERFCASINLPTGAPTTFSRFAAAMMSGGGKQKYKASTVVQYVALAREYLRGTKSEVGKVLTAVRKASSRQPRRTAYDLPPDDIRALIEAMWIQGNREFACFAYFQWWSGLRLESIGRLLFCNIKMCRETEVLICDTSDSKNQKHPGDRRVLDIPWHWRPEIADVIFYALCDMMKSRRRCPVWELYPWLWTCEERVKPPGYRGPAPHMNDALLEAWNGMGRGGEPRHPSSYTFRRNTHNFFIEQCRRTKDRSVDWERAIQYTLHANVKRLKASYQFGVDADAYLRKPRATGTPASASGSRS